MKRNIVILGSTGSIGTSSLQVLSYHQEFNHHLETNSTNTSLLNSDLDYAQRQFESGKGGLFGGSQNLQTNSDLGDSTTKASPFQCPQNHIYGLFANSSVDKLVAQVVQHLPDYCGLYQAQYQQEFLDKLKTALSPQQFQRITCLFGKDEINNFIQAPQVDLVIGAIVGFAGLESSLLALEAGKTLLLANKESLVAAGHLIAQALSANPQAKLIPLDSEHNAIFQSLPAQIQHNMCNCDLYGAGVGKILLTASGGPFLNLPLEEFKNITVAQALKHPNWAMGAKITIDSSTLINKGLEFIEAAVLFNCSAKDIKTVIHPQSIVHSGVEYLDRSLVVQMGPTNMCVPIAYALNYPNRNFSSVESLDLFSLSGLTFFPVDTKRFPNFQLSMDALEQGSVFTCGLNAANEVSVAAFLKQQISYQDIYKYNYLTLEKLASLNLTPGKDYQEIQQINLIARKICEDFIQAKS